MSLASDVVPNDHLSPAEEQLIDEMFQRYGHLNRWKLVELTHELPEWVDPQGSSLPLDPADILRNAGYSEEQIREIESELEESALADALFG